MQNFLPVADSDTHSKTPSYVTANFALITIVVTLIILGITLFVYSKTLNETNNQRNTSIAIMQSAYSLLHNVQSLESFQKDSLIVGNSDFKKDTETEARISTINNSINELTQLTNVLATLKEQALTLQNMIHNRTDMVLQVRKSYENGELKTPEGTALMNNARLTSDKITDQTNKLVSSAQQLVDENYEKKLQNLNFFTKLSMICFTLAVLGLLYLIYLYNKMHYSLNNLNNLYKSSYKKLSHILEFTSDMIIAIDNNLCLTYFNNAFNKEFYSLFQKEINIGTSLPTLFDKADDAKEKLLPIWNESIHGTELSKHVEFRLNDKNYVYEIISNPIKNDDMKIIGAILIIRNVSEHSEDKRHLEEAYNELNQSMTTLQTTNEKISLLVEMSDVILACETTNELSEVIAKFCNRILSFTGGTLYTMHPSKNYLESTASWGNSTAQEPTFSYDACWALRLGKIHYSSIDSSELLCSHIKIHPEVERTYLCVPLIAQNDIYGLLYLELENAQATLPLPQNETNLIKSLAELAALSFANVRLRENLHYHSIRDPLTSLYNRRYLEYFLSKEIVESKHKQIPICLLILDLDHFKSINDAYGHDAGDLALKEFAILLTNHCRPTDLASRYGGEEFVLVLCDTNLQVAKERAEIIRSATEKILITYGSQQISTFTVSIGIAEFPKDALNAHQLIEKADKALYHAKHTGRNKVSVAEPI